MSARIGLCMIVKNEAHVITRCLDSVRPIIDTWTIVDTGSTDGTQQVIRDALSDLPGELHERPWQDFGHNRTESLQLARPLADYSLVIDADDVLELPDGYELPELTADSYSLRFVNGPSTYWLDHLVANRLPWRFVGVLHEYMQCDDVMDLQRLVGPSVIYRQDGGRTKESPGVQKYAKDAEILERALADEPDNARYQFYLARTYRDSEQWDKALAAFQRRTEMDGFDEEVFESLLCIARLYVRMKAPPHAVIAAFLDAYEDRPSRAEPLYELARYLRTHNRYALARLYASRATEIPLPQHDSLWVNESVYAWRSRDELAVADSWTGRQAESAALCRELLEIEGIPDGDRKRIKGNLALMETRLAERAAR